MDNLTAAQSGDRRAALEQLRDTLATQLDTTTSQTHAQLAAQYRATLAELEELSVPKEGTAADDAAGRVLRLASS
jgi:hypothetical protein